MTPAQRLAILQRTARRLGCRLFGRHRWDVAPNHPWLDVCRHCHRWRAR